MPRLTKRTVEKLAIEARDYFVWDSDVTGFGVRVMPSSAKVYQVQYRKGGRTRRMSIGRHGTVTVDEARTNARRSWAPSRTARTRPRKSPSIAALRPSRRSAIGSSPRM